MGNELTTVQAHEAISLESALVNLKSKGVEDIMSPNECLLTQMMNDENDMELRMKFAVEAKKNNKDTPSTAPVMIVNNNGRDSATETKSANFDLGDM